LAPYLARKIAAILRARKKNLEFDYIEKRILELGLNSVWRGLLDDIA